MLPIVCPHLLEHEGSLIIVELGVLKKISTWELDVSVKHWQKVCSMPDHLFSKFSHGSLNYSFTVDLWGKFCLSMIFWRIDDGDCPPPLCPIDSHLYRTSRFGLALELCIGALF
jgi:hypothetical protein